MGDNVIKFCSTCICILLQTKMFSQQKHLRLHKSSYVIQMLYMEVYIYKLESNFKIHYEEIIQIFFCIFQHIQTCKSLQIKRLKTKNTNGIYLVFYIVYIRSALFCHSINFRFTQSGLSIASIYDISSRSFQIK